MMCELCNSEVLDSDGRKVDDIFICLDCAESMY